MVFRRPFFEGIKRVSSESSGLAERYASALYQLAQEGGNLDRVASDLKDLKAMMAGSEDLRRFLKNPIHSRQEHEQVLQALAEKAGFDGLTRRFLGLVARSRRQSGLSGMIGAYMARLGKSRGEMTAVVRAAQPLSDAQTAALKAELAKTSGGKVDLDITVDPSLLGGLVVRLGSRMIDSSLKTKLQNLKLAMKGVG
ncbi:ATP synthase subunit delta [Rhodospirillaceae bacterium LM-1]|nr:ATP synthase subunit delta [Rhodospirillaceae bacterium LM-1]